MSINYFCSSDLASKLKYADLPAIQKKEILREMERGGVLALVRWGGGIGAKKDQSIKLGFFK